MAGTADQKRYGMTDGTLYDLATRAGLERGFRDARGVQIETPAHAIAVVMDRLGYDVSDEAGRKATRDELQLDADRLVKATVPIEADARASIAVRCDGAVCFASISRTARCARARAVPITVD